MQRVFVERLRQGPAELAATEAAHLRDVLRMKPGDAVEAFDAAGSVAMGRIESVSKRGVVLQLDAPRELPAWRRLVVAAAVPKGDRADWMVEKLSEVGCDELLLLETARSVVVPQGTSKFDRWGRIAIESARQCRRRGVMAVPQALTSFDAVRDDGAGADLRLICSLRASAEPLARVVGENPSSVIVAIGPEGDFTDTEYASAVAAGWREVSLTPTVLRVETAAILAAAMLRVAHLDAGGHGA